jgi:hypothetical protein
LKYYKVNGVEHKIFEKDDPIPGYIGKPIAWREGKVGDWVKSDDNCVVQVLRRGVMHTRKGRLKQRVYIGTCTGTFPVSKGTRMDTIRRLNIYSFSGSKKSDDILIDRTDLNKREELFVLNLAQGVPLDEAYVRAFPTNNKRYALEKAQKLIKTERVHTAMKEELKPVLKELGISETSILRNISSIALSSEKDETRLKALFKLSDIMDLEDKNKTQVTQVTGVQFKGFLDDDLEKVERPKEIEE